MDFDRKDFVTQKIEQNGTLYQMLVQTQQIALQMAVALDAANGTQLAPQLQQQFAQAGASLPGSAKPGAAAAQQLDALGGQANRESSVVRNARTRMAESTSPR